MVSSTALDVSGWAEPRVDMCARGRASRVPWVLPTAAEAELEAAAPDTAHLRVTHRGVLDLDHALFGRPLDEQMWDFGLRVDLGGPAPSRLLSSTGFPDLLLPRRNEVAVFYNNAEGLLSLDRKGSKRGLMANPNLVPRPGPAALSGTRSRSSWKQRRWPGRVPWPPRCWSGTSRAG